MTQKFCEVSLLKSETLKKLENKKCCGLSVTQTVLFHICKVKHKHIEINVLYKARTIHRKFTSLKGQEIN